MPDWQFWAIASWFLAILFRIERINDSVKEIKRDLAKQVKREREHSDEPSGEPVSDVEEGAAQ